jgi:putative endonuclease
MYYTYILELKNKQLYTGYTSDLKRRYAEHTYGKVAFTSKRLPVRLIYYEAYQNKADAKAREKYLKSSDGKKDLQKQLKNYFSDK